MLAIRLFTGCVSCVSCGAHGKAKDKSICTVSRAKLQLLAAQGRFTQTQDGGNPFQSRMNSIARCSECSGSGGRACGSRSRTSSAAMLAKSGMMTDRSCWLSLILSCTAASVRRVDHCRGICTRRTCHPEVVAGCLPEPCLLYTSPSPRDRTRSRMPSSA